MKKYIKSLILAVCVSVPFVASAEKKVFTVDMSEVYVKYNKAVQSQEVFNKEAKKAEEEIQAMFQESLQLAEKYKEVAAKASNPALTAEARAKFQSEAEQIQTEAARKQQEIARFNKETSQTLSQRRQSVMNLHLNDIKAKIDSIAKKEDADFVINSAAGIVLFQKSGADLTDRVIAELNKN